MAATYDPGALTTSARDRIRRRLGDVRVPDGAYLQDEEIDAFLAQAGSEWRATAEAARSLLAVFSVEPDRLRRDGDVDIEFRDRLRVWQAIVREAEAKAEAEEAAEQEAARAGSRSGRLPAVDTSWIR